MLALSFGQLAITFMFLLVCVLLILVVLLQKGRGGGLSGAFGGVGGHSAFGTKTGDVFTWITVGLTFFFILFAVLGNYILIPETIADAGSDAEIEPAGEDGAAGETPPATPVTPPAPVESPRTGTPVESTETSTDATTESDASETTEPDDAGEETAEGTDTDASGTEASATDVDEPAETPDP